MQAIVINRRNARASAMQPSCNNAPGVLVALHDVTPAHAPRLERAERLIASLGVPVMTYLFVPDFHGRAPTDSCADFQAWCRAPRPFGVQWFLHGYYHREGIGDIGRVRRLTPAEWCGRALLTDGEAEFLRLRGERLDDRLRDGMRSYTTCFGCSPAGFVAPAWLYNDELLAALARFRFAYTESHFHVFELRRSIAVPAPVLTWASRSTAHRTASIAAVSAARRVWAHRPLVRVALHPGDFEHPRIVDHIARVLDALRATHRVVTYDAACAAFAST